MNATDVEARRIWSTPTFSLISDILLIHPECPELGSEVGEQCSRFYSQTPAPFVYKLLGQKEEKDLSFPTFH